MVVTLLLSIALFIAHVPLQPLQMLRAVRRRPVRRAAVLRARPAARHAGERPGRAGADQHDLPADGVPVGVVVPAVGACRRCCSNWRRCGRATTSTSWRWRRSASIAVRCGRTCWCCARSPRCSCCWRCVACAGMADDGWAEPWTAKCHDPRHDIQAPALAGRRRPIPRWPTSLRRGRSPWLTPCTCCGRSGCSSLPCFGGGYSWRWAVADAGLVSGVPAAVRDGAAGAATALPHRYALAMVALGMACCRCIRRASAISCSAA